MVFVRIFKRTFGRMFLSNGIGSLFLYEPVKPKFLRENPPYETANSRYNEQNGGRETRKSAVAEETTGTSERTYAFSQGTHGSPLARRVARNAFRGSFTQPRRSLFPSLSRTLSYLQPVPAAAVLPSSVRLTFYLASLPPSLPPWKCRSRASQSPPSASMPAIHMCGVEQAQSRAARRIL